MSARTCALRFLIFAAVPRRHVRAIAKGKGTMFQDQVVCGSEQATEDVEEVSTNARLFLQ